MTLLRSIQRIYCRLIENMAAHCAIQLIEIESRLKIQCAVERVDSQTVFVYGIRRRHAAIERGFLAGLR